MSAKQIPIWIHNCGNCDFLGTFEQVDVYFCDGPNRCQTADLTDEAMEGFLVGRDVHGSDLVWDLEYSKPEEYNEYWFPAYEILLEKDADISISPNARIDLRRKSG